jgi:predicted nucleic acid-binding protein
VELVDTSVWARKNHPTLRDWFAEQIRAGNIALCAMIALELLHTEPTPDRYRAREDDLRGLVWLPMGEPEWRRALEVDGLLAAQGNQLHRSVKHPDLFIAACAERHGVPLVHYDQDFDTIARVTGQAMRWAAPRGSLEPPREPL